LVLGLSDAMVSGQQQGCCDGERAAAGVLQR